MCNSKLQQAARRGGGARKRKIKHKMKEVRLVMSDEGFERNPEQRNVGVVAGRYELAMWLMM